LVEQAGGLVARFTRFAGSAYDAAPVASRLLHIITVPATLSLMRGQLGYCASAGFDVHLAASFGDALPVEPGVTFHSVPLRRDLAPAKDAAALARMVALIRRLRPDIVQAGTPKAALVGMLAARIVGTRTRIYHIRGLDHLAGTRGRALAAEAAQRTCCAVATNVLCVSQSVRENLVAEGFCEASKTKVLLRGSSNGVDAAGRFNPANHSGGRSELRRSLGIPEDSLVIGFVGRLVRDKGIEVLAQAWSTLRDEFPAAYLLLVGPFEDGDALPRHVKDSLLGDARVKQTQTDWGHAASLYSAMDVIGFPTVREGFPNVPLEAAAMGVPVVATRVVGAVDAVVHGQTGLLIEPRDPHALAKSLRTLLLERELRGRLGAAARARVLAEYRPEDLWAAQVAWYRQLLGMAPAPTVD
jgi:glycosyltransferase involved in cell wall biosynthesis